MRMPEVNSTAHVAQAPAFLAICFPSVACVRRTMLTDPPLTISIMLEADFCIEAVEEALARHGTPEIFNTEHGRAIGPSGHATSGQPIHVDRLHQGAGRPRDQDQRGWQGRVAPPDANWIKVPLSGTNDETVAEAPCRKGAKILDKGNHPR